MRNESLLQVAQKTGLSEPWKRIFTKLFCWKYLFQHLWRRSWWTHCGTCKNHLHANG